MSKTRTMTVRMTEAMYRLAMLEARKVRRHLSDWVRLLIESKLQDCARTTESDENRGIQARVEEERVKIPF